MNNLTLYILGLVLICIPACLSDNNNPGGEQCFSQALNPSYPCCKSNKVVYTDKSGDWGVENDQWCGIGNSTTEFCFSIALGYPCCKKCDVLFVDKDGQWGVEDNEWCGIKDNCESIVKEEDPINNNSTDVSSNNDFEFEFLKMENPKDNMIYSPLSIEYALKMLQEGANSNTLDEINKVVKGMELPKYTNIDNILSLANGFFIRDIYYKNVKTEYINTLKEKYDADVIEDEFENADNVNQWIKDKTLEIIKNVLNDEVVHDPSILMILVNALAIDMQWAKVFDTKETRGEIFYKDNGEKIMATMMFNKEVSCDCISYYIDDDLTVVSMDLREYEGTQLEFMAIMPKDNLSDYVKNVTKEQINEITKNLKSSLNSHDGVNVKIPKFNFDYNLNLKKDLMDLGIIDVFDVNRADLTKISENPIDRLYIADALHKANIEFTESGVKAAAVTVMIGGWGAMMPINKHPINVIINQPFMFIIRDKNTKDIWFTGTVYEPNLWENDKSGYSGSSNGGWS
ncbi:cellulosomal serpin precursor [Anaeromyces robustus]|uniref:Cellulosomal serpin n=1 Tax=Anaeromyces robustus TaxID=1754192 RepID=A0A1Y1WWZ9_9FUNG|nr:cellulosomal serpin precursor [Anaeromyces robustus]|eukprot:ORX78043.1 cellulosomal serpin precursor [Anaeromyces robustus]